MPGHTDDKMMNRDMPQQMPQMNDRMVANPQLDMGMPEDAKSVIMRPSESIKNALMMRLTNMTPEELRLLDEAITPRVAGVLVKLLPEMQQLIDMVEQSGVGDAMPEDQAMMMDKDENDMPKDMGALGNM